MSKVDFERKQKKEEEEKKVIEQKKVVGQQQKTQTTSHTPTGTTSIPKDTNKNDSRTRKGTASLSSTRQTTPQRTQQRNNSTDEDRRRYNMQRSQRITGYNSLPSVEEFKRSRMSPQERAAYDMQTLSNRPQPKPTRQTVSGRDFVGSKRSGLSDAERNDLEKRISNVGEYRNDNKTLTQQQKELEDKILNADRYTEDNKKAWNEELLSPEEIEEGVKKMTPETLKKWTDGGVKLDKGAEQIAKEYAKRQLNEYDYRSGHVPVLNKENREKYADLVNLMNKTSPLASFSQSALQPFLNVANVARDAGVKAAEKLGFNTDSVEEYNKQIDESNRKALENARVQDPGLSVAGQFAGNAGLYAMTNPIFDSIGAAAGVTSKAGKFALNQAGQNLQDLALDTIPTFNQLSKDGSLSEEDKRELASDAFMNVLGNAVMGGTSELLSKNKVEMPEQRIAEDVDNLTPNNIPVINNTNPYEGMNDVVVQGNVNKALGVNTPLSNLKDAQIENLTKRGGDQVVLADAYDNLLKTADNESIDDFTRSLNEYRQIVSDNNIPGLNRPLTRLEDAVNGNILPEVGAENYGSIANNVDAIEDGLNRISKLEGLSDLGVQRLDEAYKALDTYDETVRQGGDTMGAAKELSRVLGSLDNQAKKIPDYDGVFTNFRGDSVRGALYSNTGRIEHPINEETIKLTPEKEAELHELYDFMPQDRFARPANGMYNSNQVPAVESTSQNKLPMNLQQFNEVPTKIPEPEDPRFGNSRVVTNTALNSDVVSMDQIVTSPTIQDIMKYEKHSNAETLDNAINRVSTEGNVWKDDFISGKKVISDDTDVDTSMLLLQDLNKKIAETNDIKEIDKYTNEKNALLRKLREFGTRSGQSIQAFAKWNNTADGALLTAEKVSNDDVVQPWKSKNQKAVKGNSRIAKALSDMGHKPISKEAPILSHEQIKEGVKAELEKEMGSIEGVFNDNDLEYLTTLAEDKKIPVWQITDEIEHKLNHGSWYTIDESIEPKQPKNRKLQNALNSLIEGEVRNTEPVKPDLKQIKEEVRNTLKNESAEIGGMFEDSDIDYLANLVNNNATKEEIAEALNTKMATGSFGISAETQQKVNDLFKQAEMYNPDSKEFVEAQAEAFKVLAEEILPNATGLEKFDAWRYMAMLGNPKTMLRNYIGNKMFSIVTGISNNLSALGEEAVDKAVKGVNGKGIQRTKAILNPIEDSDLISASKLDADASRYRQMQGSKYEKMDKDALRRSRSVFNTKIGQLAEKAVDAGISDYSAIKNKYATSLAGYLKANGFDKSIFDAEVELKRLKNMEETQLLSASQRKSIEDLTQKVSDLEKARDFALKQAEYATFHEDNAFAKWLTKISTDARNSDSKVLNAVGTIIEGTVPFKKTPANVLRSGLEFSPLGAIDSIKKTGKLIYENTGKRAGNLADTYINSKGKEVTKTLAADVIDSWSKTLTGTGLAALGFYLYDKGILNSSDKETKWQDQLEGLQNYAIKINGKTYTVDWMAPAVMPLLLGAEINKVWNAEGKETAHWYEHLDEYMNAFNRLADPIVETSMLQGIKDTLDTAAKASLYNENSNIPALLAYNSVTGYATQAIPTIGGQIARTVDNTRRSTYTDKEGVAGVVDTQIKKTMNKLPFVSKLNQPYVDTYGREQRNSPTDNPLLGLGYQMLSPGYLADVNTTDADTMSRQLFEATEDEGVLPKYQSSLKIDGQRVSPETYTDYAKTYGETNYSVRDALTKDEWFNSLEDTEKAEIVKDINTLANNVGKAKVTPDFTSSSKPFEAFSQGGIPGLIDYYKSQYYKGLAKESGLSASTNAFKEIQADFEAGNDEEAQQKIDLANNLQSLGLNDSQAFSTYERIAANSDISVEEFANTYKELDSNGKNGISQQEILDYANSGNHTQAEIEDLWKNYLNKASDSYVPALVDGTWKKKKVGSSNKTSTSGSQKSNLGDYKKARDITSKSEIPSADDLPTADSSDGLNWSLNNGYDLKNTKTYARAKEAGISDSDFVNAWWAADTDGNGYMKKAEAQAYVNALQGLSKEEKNKWFNVLYKGR